MTPRKRSFPERIKRRVKGLIFPSVAGAKLYSLSHPLKKTYTCPICGYKGPFRDDLIPTYRVCDVHCPSCGSNVRMRLQYLTVERLQAKHSFSKLSMHHFSPEKAMGVYFQRIFGSYFTCGITNEPVDYPADITNLPFTDESCDFIFASHILEYI